jgi:hypothetical protein
MNFKLGLALGIAAGAIAGWIITRRGPTRTAPTGGARIGIDVPRLYEQPPETGDPPLLYGKEARNEGDAA